MRKEIFCAFLWQSNPATIFFEMLQKLHGGHRKRVYLTSPRVLAREWVSTGMIARDPDQDSSSISTMTIRFAGASVQ